MPQRILCDENLPNAVVDKLREWGFDAVRVTSGASDSEIAALAKRERRVILTFDSDFANILAYPPKDYFGIIRLNITPPFIDIIFNALRNCFNRFKNPEDFRGKLIILGPARLRVWGEE